MDIISKAEQFVINLFKDNLSSAYSFHNISHTQRVVEAVKIISETENCSTEDKENLFLAAWFHDVGYCHSCAKHEKIGMDMVADFLEKEGVAQEKIQHVQSLINATAFQYIPQNRLEEIIKDSDTSHIGSDEFFQITEELRKECREVQNQNFTKLDWARVNLQFILMSILRRILCFIFSDLANQIQDKKYRIGSKYH